MNVQRAEFDERDRIETPGHSSKGNQPKWTTADRWYKADFMGYEGLAEVLISRLLKYSNVPEYVKYDSVSILYDGKTVPGCSSLNFRKKGEILISIERLHRAYHGIGLALRLARMELDEKIRYTVDFVEETTGMSHFGPYLTMMLELDCFFLNEDRHTNNIAVIRNESTGEYRLCPIYDNGLSLLSDLRDYPPEQDLYTSIAKVEAKPFDQDFDVQVEAAEVLYHPQLKLSFSRQNVQNELAGLKEYYSEDVIYRVEKIILEQMRKYPVFFQNRT